MGKTWRGWMRHVRIASPYFENVEAIKLRNDALAFDRCCFKAKWSININYYFLLNSFTACIPGIIHFNFLHITHKLICNYLLPYHFHSYLSGCYSSCLQLIFQPVSWILSSKFPHGPCSISCLSSFLYL